MSWLCGISLLAFCTQWLIIVRLSVIAHILPLASTTLSDNTTILAPLLVSIIFCIGAVSGEQLPPVIAKGFIVSWFIKLKGNFYYEINSSEANLCKRKDLNC